MLMISHYDDGSIKETGVKVGELMDGWWQYYFPNGQLYLLCEYKMGTYGNGWSYIRWNELGYMQEMRCYSNKMIIEQITLNAQGLVDTHFVWNNRWKEMVNKFTITEVAAGSRFERTNSFEFFVTHLPAISKFINADYGGQDFEETYATWLQECEQDEPDDYSSYKEYIWVLTAPKMEMVICCKRGEEIFRWHLRANNVETANAAKAFIDDLPPPH